MNIQNPILPGFNPDPSIIRVEDTYYIATSTFQWFPGVQIHESRDLVNWRLHSRPLRRHSQLDLSGVPDNGGVWAPCLSYCDGTFYLVYSIIRNFSAYPAFNDIHNYLVTTTDIAGEWSEPLYLLGASIDVSLFHDDERKWVLFQDEMFKSIALREYDMRQRKLVGPAYRIFEGTKLGVTEGPHLYTINGYYYLVLAEGGTGRRHAVTVARSRNLLGPYEVDPANPMLTASDDPRVEIQNAGHADLVQTPAGAWYMVHLGSRPLPSRGLSILGRETCIQKVVWDADDWLRLEQGSKKPATVVPAPDVPEQVWEPAPARDDFEAETLSSHFQTVRFPLGEESLSLKERPGFLRLKGGESLRTLSRQTLIARRQQAFCYTASACFEFEPESVHQLAGLICYYNRSNYHYLHITKNREGVKCLSIITCDNTVIKEPLYEPNSIEGWQQCHLRVDVDYDRLEFAYSRDGHAWTSLGPVLDAGILSDEYPGEELLNFTGAFVGLCCQDHSGQQGHTDVDYFEYQERAFRFV